MLVTSEFASRIEKRNWNDPLLKQVWPADEEAVEADGFKLDPVGDGNARVEAGLLHKYEARVLLIATGACAIHCRYCFRRHYPYSEEPKSTEQWEPAIEHIRSDKSIHEVILSGGDPLMLSDLKLSRLVEKIESIPHVERLRIHTRLPIVLPSRVDDSMLNWLESTRLSTWVVVHCNHRNEIDDEVRLAITENAFDGCGAFESSCFAAGGQ